MHKLVIEDDEGKTVVVPLIRDEITIGRQEGNTIRLTERNVSRRHARLLRREGTVFVEDLSSYLGTKVNGEAVTSMLALKDGDRVQIGDYRLSLKEDRASHTARYGEPVTGSLPPVAAPVVPMPPSMVPEAAIEGAPTIPVRTLGDQSFVAPMAAPPVVAAPPARLVVMSAPIAGAEFTLDRASLVIGRTPENDIVLNHKSISRHHAKIIRDGDRYVVVDLESANGVRVNGTEFERVELHGGDVLELGHVRLRFVGANETFVDEPHLLSMPGGSKKPLMIGGIAVLAVAGIAFAMLGGSKKSPEPAAVVTSTKPAAATPPPTPATPTPAPPAEPATAAPAVGELLASARQAIEQEKWSEALAAIEKASALSPGAETAELRRKIEVERESAGQFATIKKASQGKDFETVLTAFRAIPDDSSYKERARGLHDEARDKFVAQHLALAERRRAAGSCDDARKEAELVLAVDTGNAAAQSVVNRCEAQQAEAARAAAARAAKPAVAARPAVRPATPTAVAARPPAPIAPKPTAAAPAATAAEEEPAAGGGDADALMQQAQDAWLRGQYAAAIESSRKALRARPNLGRAHQIIAVCSCSLRDASSAARAYEKLDDKAKQLVRSLCQKSGITLE